MHKGGLTDLRLQSVVDRVRAGAAVPPGLARVRGQRVRVEVVGARGAAVARAVSAVGGTQVGPRVRGLVLADVPAAALRGLERGPAVDYVRLPLDVSAPQDVETTPGDSLIWQPTVARTGAKGYDAVQKTAIAPWHAAGFTGSGIKVGIIDSFNATYWNSAAAAGEVPAAPAGAICRNAGVDCGSSFWNSNTQHGTAVAEVITDMAPGAQLYLATAGTATDLKAAVDYFHSQGVRIISRSETARYDGPGNGTGPIADVMAYAASQGIAWFNSAGNSAGNGSTWPGAYFRQYFQDLNANGWMEFPGSKYPEYLEFSCSRGFINGVRWSDWGTGRTDYDAYVYEEPSDATLISQSKADQTAGAAPIENALSCTTGSDSDYLSIYDYAANGGTAGDIMEFMTNDSRVEKASSPYSATGPAADTSTPGTAAVGAVDPVAGTTIAGYSSQGPTNDGRIKPDLSAASGISSYSYPGAAGFQGTSAATPVVAGAAAVVLGSNPALSPAQLVDAMKGAVADRGTPGPDNVYGTGELTMPAPPAPPTGSATVTGTSVRPIASKLTGSLSAAVLWDVSGTQTKASVWRSVAGADFANPVDVGADHAAASALVIGKANQFAIRLADPSGYLSPWAYTRVYRPVVVDDRARAVHYRARWHAVGLRSAYHHTLAGTKGGRGFAKLRFSGSSVSVVMAKSGNSGKARITVDGHTYAKVNLRTHGVKAKRIVTTVSVGTGRHTIRVQPLTHGRNGWVYLDGFLVVR